MGKAKVKHMTIKKMFQRTYSQIMLWSLVTTSILLIILLSVYNHIGDNDKNRFETREQVLDYIERNSQRIIAGDLNDLNSYTENLGIRYYIVDENNQQIYNSYDLSRHNFSKITWNARNNSYSLSIPLYDSNGTYSQTIFLQERNDSGVKFLIGVSIPIASFVFFTLYFSHKSSNKITNPLDELSISIERIKEQDLDFTIETSEDNEIGDLARAFEEMRRTLKESLIREWQLEQDRRDMVAAITHDLKTPMTIIQGHAEGLQSGLINDPDKLDKYLNIILDSTQRARKLINDMNVITEIDGDTFTLYPQNMDIKSFLESKIEEFKLLANDKDIQISLEFKNPDNHDQLISVDSTRLAQILDNIIANSIRFTPKNGFISVYATVTEDSVDFTIRDSGDGFIHQDFEQVFKKFYKSDSSRNEKGHSGLGLYISKRLVEIHGGSISASNHPEGGAVIQFNIKYQ